MSGPDDSKSPRAARPKIVLGTSGWSFPDWVGRFYPSDIDRSAMLDYYVHEFPAVEVNSTYYRIPHPRTFHAIERKTPPGFEFVVKTHHDMTHLRTDDPQLYKDFDRAMQPLRDAGKLTGILAQFPHGFRRTRANEEYLGELKGRLGGHEPLFVEFRHESWNDEKVFDRLESEGLGYTSVDEPDLPGLMPPIARATGPIGYVRFHGRNKEKWWGADGMGRGAPDRRGVSDRPKEKRVEAVAKAASAKGPAALGPLFSGSPEEAGKAPASRRRSSTRYDYLYTEDELKEWVGKIREMTANVKKTFVFFNNCHVGQAASSAKLMRRLLEGEGLL